LLGFVPGWIDPDLGHPVKGLERLTAYEVIDAGGMACEALPAHGDALQALLEQDFAGAMSARSQRG